MRFVVTLTALFVLVAFQAIAGKNENGAMIVHTSDSYDYSGGTACTAPEGDPGTCENAVTQANREAGQVVWLLAAFPPTAAPGVTVVYFGIDYDDANLDPGVNYRNCGPAGTIEIPDTDWPYGGRGNSVAFGTPITGDILFPFYVFRIDNFGGTAPGPYFCTMENPIGGYAAFVDDSNPPLLDNCTRFGCVRWFEPGSADCPPVLVQGACCSALGECQLLTPEECNAACGSYQGDGISCNPNPCPACWCGACCFPDGSCQILPEEVCTAQGGDMTQCAICVPDLCPVEIGACCFADGTCRDLTEQECTDAGGSAWFAGQTCADEPCPPTATESTTWGKIRATFR